MSKVAYLGAIAGILVAGAATAQSPSYTWSGYGTNVPGSSKCPTYKMTINVTVEGNSVKGRFVQEGRPERHFEAAKDASGLFKTKAEVGGGGSMDVSGSVKDGDSKILLDGYCKFGGPLTKK
ncbi:MAG: hypothetical protein JOY64_20315 [Alphaproteobacteria bacterium]|nr:hypothetical protein [Alphaproteobacteria bacterium]MBV8409983.1 hypothetical protein [Alphaproteobacteria bacterium]